MNHLHEEFDIGPEDVVEVTLNSQANVLLLDSSNYNNYRNGHALLSAGLAFVVTLTTTTITLNRLFFSYLIISINFFLVGFLLLGYWWKSRTSGLGYRLQDQEQDACSSTDPARAT